MLGVSKFTLKRWEKGGKFPVKPVPDMGRAICFDAEEVDQWWKAKLLARETPQDSAG